MRTVETLIFQKRKVVKGVKVVEKDNSERSQNCETVLQKLMITPQLESLSAMRHERVLIGYENQ